MLDVKWHEEDEEILSLEGPQEGFEINDNHDNQFANDKNEVSVDNFVNALINKLVLVLIMILTFQSVDELKSLMLLCIIIFLLPKKQ